jgi:hypothetical protein
MDLTITETTRIQLILVGMHSRTLGPSLAAVHRTLIQCPHGMDTLQDGVEVVVGLTDITELRIL